MSESAEPLTVDASGQPAGHAKRRMPRYALYALALFGVSVLAFAAWLLVTKVLPAKQVAINETEVIDRVMTRTYGKYSADKGGWLFAGETNFVMNVVHQTLLGKGTKDETLYFVTSGTPIDPEVEAGLYGVFQIRTGDAKTPDQLVEVSMPAAPSGARPLAPENVHFEALSDTQWAWVVKTDTTPDGSWNVTEGRNTVLAAHGGKIVKLATFKADYRTTVTGDCADAERRYLAWVKASKEAAAPPPAADPQADPAAAPTPEPEAAEMPLRCNDIVWSYRSAPPAGPTPVPLVVSVKGIRDGAKVPEKSWKLTFNAKRFAYAVPAELQAELND